MRIKIRIITLLPILLLLCLNRVFSQPTVKFKHIKVRDGLSQSWIRTIHQDWQGFMWFGTNNGLNKYDGYAMTIYYSNFKDKNSLNSNGIHTIYEDCDHNLWIGTDKGINLYDREKDQFIHRSSWPQAEITDFLELTNGQFFIATRDNGLLLFHPDSGLIKSYSPDANNPSSIGSYVIDGLFKDSQGNIWIATTNGLSLFNLENEEFITFRHDDNNPSSLSGNNIQSLREDKDGRIWVGTANNGLNLLQYPLNHPEKSGFTHFIHNPEVTTSISPGAIISLLNDKTGHLWIGTENGGLDRITLNSIQKDKVVFQHFQFNPYDNASLSNNSIYSLFEDRDGGIWVGTYGDGINYYHPLKEKFLHIKQELNNPNSLNNNFVNVFFEDGDSLWIGTEGGVNLFNKRDGSYRHFVFDPNNNRTIGANAVWAIHKDSRRNLWFGTWAGGLNLFNHKTDSFTRFKHDALDSLSIPGNNIFSVLEDHTGNLWIGVMGGGLCQFNYKTQTFKNYNRSYTDNSGISNKWVSTLLEDSFGKLWIATSGAVDLLDLISGTFKTFRYDTSITKSISDKFVTTLFEDSQKNIWIGTNNGLNVFNRLENNFDYYSKEQGLSSDQIKGILEDYRGNLWISTNKGLSKFIQGTKQPAEPVFKNYDIDDGLQGNEFTQRSCLRGRDGRMYFGGNNGFNVFHPDSIKESDSRSSILLTNFLIYNKPVLIGVPNSPLHRHISLLNEITLNHKQSVFSIEYTMLNYLSPNKNQYAFMLEGFDTDWNYVGNQRLATYTNLDPGEYIFRVKGTANNDWEQADVSLKITIIPPWWATIWAWLFYSASAGLLLFSIWRFQLNRRAMKHELMLEHQHAEKLEELNTMKSRFFANITHEFRSPLTLIMGPMKQILAGEAKSNIADIARTTLRNSERLYQLINQILELSKLEAGRVPLRTQKTDIVPFIEKITLSFAPLAESRKITLQFIAADDLKTTEPRFELFIDIDKIQKVITNLLSNALKFTPENGTVTVSIKCISDENYIPKKVDQSGYIEICVKDNGPGLRAENLEKIFDRFYQAADPHSGAYESTGIGLALAKELVELHSGTIHVESVFENGAAFFVRLPLGCDHLNPSEISHETEKENPSFAFTPAEAEINEQDKSISSEQEIKSKKHVPILLIVDDNADIRKYLAEHLKEEYRIVTAKNGQTGLEMANSHVPDLIVSDVVMPNLNGIELCTKIKTNELTSHIPVILLTVRASDESKIEGLETGADDYITKPFEIKELKARIRNLIEQRRQFKKKMNRKLGLQPSEITSKSMDERFINKLLTIIEANLNQPEFGVEELAREVSLSRVQLYRKIRAITGQTAAEFIRTVRLNRAAQLLKQKHDNIAQIAYDVGFHNPSYFSSAFYKHFGVYPSEFVEK